VKQSSAAPVAAVLLRLLRFVVLDVLSAMRAGLDDDMGFQNNTVDGVANDGFNEESWLK
jgi:hypothetical protein